MATRNRRKRRKRRKTRNNKKNIIFLVITVILVILVVISGILIYQKKSTNPNTKTPKNTKWVGKDGFANLEWKSVGSTSDF